MEHNQITLCSLAVLKVGLDEVNQDYYGYFEKFVISLLRRHNPNPVTNEAVAELFGSDYGLKLPTQVVQLILRRITKKGLLVRTYGVYRIRGELPSNDIYAKRVDVTRQIERVQEALREYAQMKFDLAWTQEEVDSALFGFLYKFGVDCLRSYIFHSVLPNNHIKDNRVYVVSKFISDANVNNQQIFDSVIVLVKGLMYANVLTCPDLEGIQKDFKKVRFFFDTPLIFDLLKVNREEYSAPTLELAGLIKKLKGKLAVFEHTIKEVEGALKYAESNIQNPDFGGKIIYRMRENNWRKSEITILIGELDERIKDAGIEIVRTPKFVEKHQVDEGDLENQLREAVKYKSKEGSLYDVNSVRSIYVIRKGTTPRRIEDAAAVLITNNQAFAETAFRCGQNHNTSKEVSSVVTDYSIANIAFLKSPMDAPDLPRKETIAACYAAMEVPAGLFNKYLDETDKMVKNGAISPDQHVLLRSSGAAKELMDLTLGDEDAFNSGTVSSVWERYERAIKKETTEKIEKERASIHKIIAAEKATTQEIKDENTGLKNTIQTQDELLGKHAERLASVVSNFVFWALVGLVILAGLVTLSEVPVIGLWLNTVSPKIWIVLNSDGVILTTISGIIFTGSVILGVYFAYAGQSIKSIVEKVKNILKKFFHKNLKKMVGRN